MAQLSCRVASVLLQQHQLQEEEPPAAGGTASGAGCVEARIFPDLLQLAFIHWSHVHDHLESRIRRERNAAPAPFQRLMRSERPRPRAPADARHRSAEVYQLQQQQQ